jgi:hypothetical protein
LFFDNIQIPLQAIDIPHDSIARSVLEEGAVEDAAVLGEFFLVFFLLLF